MLPFGHIPMELYRLDEKNDETTHKIPCSCGNISSHSRVHQCVSLVSVSFSRYCWVPAMCQMPELRLALLLRYSSEVKRQRP